MIYRILCNGVSLWEHYPAMEVLDPQLEIELNAAGSLQFTMTPDHLFFDSIRPLIDTIEVYEENDLIWFGRPVELERDIGGLKSCYCEGALAWFNDSVQRPREQAEVNAETLFRSIVTTHNGQAGASRQFTVGTVTVDKTIVYDNDYTSSMDAMGALLDRAGGYLIPRRENGVNYLDWLAELPEMWGQGVEFGLNMVKFNRQYGFGDLVTGVLPVGGIPEPEEGQDPPTEPITIAPVNEGSDILLSDAGATYGGIVRTVRYSDITDPQELLEAAQVYLEDVQFDPVSIQVSAADLHFLDERKPAFRVGTVVHVVSVPHLLDRHLPLTKLSFRLDRAAREVTLGTERRRAITDIIKKVEEEPSKIDRAELDRINDSISGLYAAIDGIDGGDDGWIHWHGTLEEYSSIQQHSNHTVYFITM